jgi:hypothetical protein
MFSSDPSSIYTIPAQANAYWTGPAMGSTGVLVTAG